MSTENNNQGVPDAPVDAGKVDAAVAQEFKLSKEDYDSYIESKATIGSLKRELKDLKKSSEESSKDNGRSTNTDNPELLQKAFLRSAGISGEDEVTLALQTSKKWGIPVDQLVDDDDFKVKLEKVRTQKANEKATSGIQGTGGKGDTKSSSEYWIAKGTPPTPADVSDRKTRAKIVRDMMRAEKGGSKFYNE